MRLDVTFRHLWSVLAVCGSYVLEKVDLVIVGAEGVVESGGIINKVCGRERIREERCSTASPEETPQTVQVCWAGARALTVDWCLVPSLSLPQIGTYQMAMCSKAHNKPFYVVAESFKFVRLYPLNQQDVPDKFKVGAV